VLLQSLYHRSDTDTNRDCFGSPSPQPSATITHDSTVTPQSSIARRHPRKSQGYTQHGSTHSRKVDTKKDLVNYSTIWSHNRLTTSMKKPKHKEWSHSSLDCRGQQKRHISMPTQTLHGSKETLFALPLSAGVRRTPASASPLLLQLGGIDTDTPPCLSSVAPIPRQCSASSTRRRHIIAQTKRVPQQTLFGYGCKWWHIGPIDCNTIHLQFHIYVPDSLVVYGRDFPDASWSPV
jgi:hypothetical protein